MEKKRLEYLDAMRGVAILFIVFGHIPLYCYGVAETDSFSSFRLFTSTVQLPLFFFISGFLFSVRSLFNKSGGVKFEYVLKRAKQLLVPAIVFGSIFLLLNGGTVEGCLTDKFKYGYWFTFSLFEFLMIQVVMEWMMRKLSIVEDSIRYLFMLVAIAVVSYAVSFPVVCQYFGDMGGVLGLPLLRYYVYFVAGRLIRVHLNAICAWKWRDAAVTVTVMAFILIAVLFWGLDYECSGLLFHVRMVVFEMSALLLFFAMFYRHRYYFSSDNGLVNALSFVGKRTLDIYLLHYFFLPKDLHVVGRYFVEHPSLAIEFVMGMFVTFIIVALCLFVSEMLRSSRFVTRWALGSK